jgi:EAL domain-containing protein (putative c-di-GMP-specific phosphodiesterase class I)
VGSLELVVTSSLGVAMFPRDGDSFEVLLRNADAAMYKAKEDGRNTLRFYDAQMNRDVVEALQLVTSMRGALARGEFELHYQPQFELAGGTVCGAEALLRWHHPDLGLLGPARFIPLAERSGLIIEIGRWVLQQACRQAARWEREGLGRLVIAVNLSPVQFHRAEIESDVVEALRESGIAPDQLELEITESLLVDDAFHLREMMSRLGAMGVRFAIDDFGTGYSNLAYLKRFSVQRLKIDQSFVRNMCTDHDHANLVRAVIDIARNLGLQSVAEGVEDGTTLERLRELGCEFAQGYFWSPALPVVAFGEYVAGLGAGAGNAARPVAALQGGASRLEGALR